MINEVEALIRDYVSWLQDKTVVHQVSDQWVAVTTPHLDRQNDYLRIYVTKRNGGFRLTDGGYIIDDLEHGGCSLSTPKREELLATTLAGFGVRNQDGELMVDATADSFAVRKHNLVQAMLAVNDLFYLAQPTVLALFHEDVTSWLEDNDIRYFSNFKLTGTTGYDHHFDFVVPKSRQMPERFLQAINNPNRDMAQMISFKWVDTRDVRQPGSRAYALLNDQERHVSQAVLDAMVSYEIRPVLWSQREDLRDELAA